MVHHEDRRALDRDPADHPSMPEAAQERPVDRALTFEYSSKAISP